MISFPAVLCGLLFLALFVAIWLVKLTGQIRRRPARAPRMRKPLINAVLLAAAVWGMLDSETVLAEGLAVTATGDTPTTNFYGALNAYCGDMGRTGENLWVNVRVATTATSGGGATIQAVLQDSADGTTFADVQAGPVFAVANVIAGIKIFAQQPPPGMRQYWRVVIRVGTAVLTAGAFDVYVTNALQRKSVDPAGFVVS